MTNVAVKTSQPISKLYKRCAWKRHDQCPGSFETHSVCSCPCHAPKPVKAAKPKPVSKRAVKTPQVAALPGMTPLGFVDILKGNSGSAKALRAAFQH